MDNKILFFDIDGTLMGRSMSLTARNLEAIQVLHEKGYLMFICTGRALTSVYPAIMELGFDGYVTSAGAIIYVGRKSIYEHYLDKPTVTSVLHLFADQGIGFTIETKHALYQTKGVRTFFDEMHSKEDSMNQELKRMKEVKRHRANVIDFSEFHFDTPVTKITFVAKDKTKFEEIRSFFADKFNVVIFSDDKETFCNGELIDKTCTKGDAVAFVCDYYGIDIANSIAFGDSMNDYEMLERAGVSVVAKGASEQLRDLGQYFFDDPDDDGIYHVVKEMGLI